jgi:hypothetical protein
MRADPIRQRLREGRFGIGVVRGPEHGHEDLHGVHRPGLGVVEGHRASGIVDEQALTGHVDLAQRRLEVPGPGFVEVAEPRVTEAVRGAGAVLLPEQGEGDVVNAD